MNLNVRIWVVDAGAAVKVHETILFIYLKCSALILLVCVMACFFHLKLFLLKYKLERACSFTPSVCLGTM